MSDESDRRPPGVSPQRHISFGQRSAAREVERELHAHHELKVDELVAAGMSRDDAERTAREAFGDRQAIAVECADVRIGREQRESRREWFSSIGQDVRVAVRGLLRSPAFSTVAVLTLALGIGANTALFSAIDAIVYRGVPGSDADRLVAPTIAQNVSVSKQRLESIRARQRAFTSLAAYSRWGLTLTGSGRAEQLPGTMVTANVFDVLGVRPLLGRTFVEGEDRLGQNRVVVLGHGVWNERFGADSAILGKSITLNGNPHTVVGVMPPGFAFPVAESRLYVPTAIMPDSTDDYVSGYLLMVGRLRDAVTRDAALTDFRRVVRDLATDNGAGFKADDEAKVLLPSLRDVLVGKVGRTLFLLLGAVGFVLLIACVNVANLLLARATVREREFAVRASLGAGRRRLVRQLVTESLLLALAGGAAGVALAKLLVTSLAAGIPSQSPGVATIGLDVRVLVFSLALSIVVGLVFGLAPALRLSRSDASDVLRDGGRGSTTGSRRHGMMRTLVVAEVALALVLAVGAGLVLQSFWRLRNESPGFAAGGVLSFVVSTNLTRHPTEESQAAFFRALFERLRAQPGVESVGAIHLLPLSGGNWNPSLGIEGRPLPEGATPREVDWRLVSPDYFRTLRIPLVAGRLFDDTDIPSSPAVALVNRELAQRYFPGEDPIGRRVRTFFEGRGNYVTIVGVVGDTKDQALGGDARPQIYRSFWQRPQTWMGVLVRSSTDPMSLAPGVRQVVADLDADAPVTNLRPFEDVVSASISQERLLMWLLGAFGVLAVALGTIGIYGVMSYVVEQRSPEIGVRLAMGARPRDIRSMVLVDALRLTAIGLVVGAIVALGVTRILSTQLHEVSARDPLVFLGTMLVLALIAVLASWIPARRASRTEPTMLLRVG
jgi:putative ABC transport system permease protein